MNRRLILCLLPLALCQSACQQREDIAIAPQARSWKLPTIQATPGTSQEYGVAGSVVPQERVDIASRLSAYILDVAVQEGDRVRRGQVLVKMDARDIDGNARQAHAGVSAAEAVAHNAQTDLERFQPLFERGSIADNEWRKVQLRAEAARASLNQARAALDAAVAQNDYAVIKSPIDGVVVTRDKRAGDLAVPGQPVLTLESTHGLVFETFVTEAQLAMVKAGKTVSVQIDGLAQPLNGTISHVVPSGDAVTRRHQVKITLPETPGLAAGMYGRARFAPGDHTELMVPRVALVERGGLLGVFVIDGGSRARFRWLRIGHEWPERVEVTAGLAPGERLVAAMDAGMRDGIREGDQIIATP